MSEALERFKECFFVSPSRDGAEVELLDALDSKERLEAEGLLIGHLDNDADREVQALGYLRSTEALEPIRRIFCSSCGHMRAVAAQALWRITRDRDGLAALCELSKPGLLKDKAARLSAVIALGDIDDPLASGALSQCLDDRDPLIAYHALDALAVRLGLTQRPDRPLGAVNVINVAEDVRRRAVLLEMVRKRLDTEKQEGKPTGAP